MSDNSERTEIELAHSAGWVAERALGAGGSSVRAACFLTLVFVALPVRAVAQNGREKPTRTIPVVLVSEAEAGTPLSGAIVRDSLSGSQATTGDDGIAKLKSAIAAGPFYILTVSRVGFRSQSLKLDAAEVLDANAVVLVDLAHLDGRFTTLGPMVTTATASTLSKNMRGFETRRRNVRLRGKFVTPDELRTKWKAGDIHDIFLSDGLTPLSTAGKARATCPVAYFVNGVRWNDIPTQANAYEAIEFYPSALMAPADIIGALAFDVHYCGIYVMWLRESL